MLRHQRRERRTQLQPRPVDVACTRGHIVAVRLDARSRPIEKPNAVRAALLPTASCNHCAGLVSGFGAGFAKIARSAFDSGSVGWVQPDWVSAVSSGFRSEAAAVRAPRVR